MKASLALEGARTGNMKRIQCVECQYIVGTVSMVPVDAEKRPGINRTECNPNPMPTTCPKCNHALQRITGG